MNLARTPHHVADAWKTLFVLWFYALLAVLILSELAVRLQ